MKSKIASGNKKIKKHLMKFKLNNTELVTLTSFLLSQCEGLRLRIRQGYTPSPDALLHLAISEEMLLKFQQQTLIKKNKYSVKLKPQQAISFWICLNGKMEESCHLGNMIQTMCNAIHQQLISK